MDIAIAIVGGFAIGAALALILYGITTRNDDEYDPEGS